MDIEIKIQNMQSLDLDMSEINKYTLNSLMKTNPPPHHNTALTAREQSTHNKMEPLIKHSDKDRKNTFNGQDV